MPAAHHAPTTSNNTGLNTPALIGGMVAPTVAEASSPEAIDGKMISVPVNQSGVAKEAKTATTAQKPKKAPTQKKTPAPKKIPAPKKTPAPKKSSAPKIKPATAKKAKRSKPAESTPALPDSPRTQRFRDLHQIDRGLPNSIIDDFMHPHVDSIYDVVREAALAGNTADMSELLFIPDYRRKAMEVWDQRDRAKLGIYESDRPEWDHTVRNAKKRARKMQDVAQECHTLDADEELFGEESTDQQQTDDEALINELTRALEDESAKDQY
ncbi:hypothetical protein S40285_10179 [Stachybotrys chlorohalonatus IBT 40285]|uniref:Uncharacterized protein n=1 Tax=Stachybotrys chlorohalonatus (strain IBT 40285) TaxID=1283841 RepID=A0A084QCR9_STAC4|nr:hypothetical protein S40285_10179 [Stachybotrys chlorohalonata IBT 40285]